MESPSSVTVSRAFYYSKVIAEKACVIVAAIHELAERGFIHHFLPF
jgi:hypothetical protein